jgi:hypothetical protein
MYKEKNAQGTTKFTGKIYDKQIAQADADQRVMGVKRGTREIGKQIEAMDGDPCAEDGRLTARRCEVKKQTEVTTSGLTANDEAELTKRLNGLEQLASRSFLLGGADRTKVEDALKRIRQRLNPEQPSTLIKFADEVLRQYVPNATWVSDEVRAEVMRAVG